MKKILLSILLAGTLVLVACNNPSDKATNETKQTENKKEEQATKTEDQKITVILKEDNKEFEKKEVAIKDKEKLLDALKANFKIESDNTGFITSIEGKKQDKAAKKYWMYTVNGKTADVGANQYEPKAGDTVEFNLSPYEK